MLRKLFQQAHIPAHKPVLVHARLRGIHNLTGTSYQQLSKTLLDCLLDCDPSLLLIPAFTIYGFMATRIFHRQYSHSEVGRFSEEVRLCGYPRTLDPMYSMLDILDNLPTDLDETKTFGPKTAMDYLKQQDGLIVNIDMPGFYATPIHSVELDHHVPYRTKKIYKGKIQSENTPWIETHYTAYVREVSRFGTGSFPPYNQKRRLHYLRQQNVIHETSSAGVSLAWSSLDPFCTAINRALKKDIHFLIDQVPAP